MKIEILERIKQLGGNVENVKGSFLKDDLLAITFDTILYQRPVDTPWASAERRYFGRLSKHVYDQRRTLGNCNEATGKVE